MSETLQHEKALPSTPRSSETLPIIISNLTTSPVRNRRHVRAGPMRRAASMFSLPSLSSLLGSKGSGGDRGGGSCSEGGTGGANSPTGKHDEEQRLGFAKPAGAFHVRFWQGAETDKSRSPVASPSRTGRRQHQRHHRHLSSNAIDESVAEEPSDRSADTTEDAGFEKMHRETENELADVGTRVRLNSSSSRNTTLARPVENHPGPLSSNPPTCQSSEDGKDGSVSEPRPRGTHFFGTEVQAKLDEISVRVDSIIRPLSQIYALDPAAVALDAWTPPTPPSDSVMADTWDLPPLPEDDHNGNTTPFIPPTPPTRPPSWTRGSTPPATLLHEANGAFFALRTAHERVIAIHESTIAAHERTISELSRQLRQSAESPNGQSEKTNETALTREERWDLLGRLTELQKKVAALESTLRLAGRGDDVDMDAKRKGFVGGNRWRSGSDAGSSLSRDWSSSASRGPRSSNGATQSPDTRFTPVTSPPYSPRLSGDESVRGRRAATPTPSTRGIRSVQVTPNPGERVSLAAHLMVVAKQKSKLGQNSAAEDAKPAAADDENEAKIGSRECPKHTPARTFVAPAPSPIPDLPVLTYNKPSEVWRDRVSSAFKYHGLLEFIQPNSTQPDPSVSSAAELAAWTNRRLRAAVLLKHAVDDNILEDVLYVLRQRDKRSSTMSTMSQTASPSPTTEDPRRLLTTILMLRRIFPSSATDLSWIDRISDNDFADGVEGFASLVLCVDKRHGALYGTSADHYEALLPRIQENMARRFPELGGEKAPVDGSPRKWLHASKSSVTIWMAKAVKRRQVGGEP